MSADNEKNTDNFVDFDFEELAKTDNPPDLPETFPSEASSEDNAPFGDDASVPFSADVHTHAEENVETADGETVSTDNPYLNTTAKPAKKERAKKTKPKKEKRQGDLLRSGDLQGTLCLVFAGFLTFALLTHNIASILCRGDSLLQTLCFIGAFDIVGLCGIAVPVLFYRYKEDLDLFKVMLGISSAALFVGVLMMLTEFFRYGFMIKP